MSLKLSGAELEYLAMFVKAAKRAWSISMDHMLGSGRTLFGDYWDQNCSLPEEIGVLSFDKNTFTFPKFC